MVNGVTSVVGEPIPRCCPGVVTNLEDAASGVVIGPKSGPLPIPGPIPGPIRPGFPPISVAPACAFTSPPLSSMGSAFSAPPLTYSICPLFSICCRPIRASRRIPSYVPRPWKRTTLAGTTSSPSLSRTSWSSATSSFVAPGGGLPSAASS